VHAEGQVDAVTHLSDFQDGGQPELSVIGGEQPERPDPLHRRVCAVQHRPLGQPRFRLI
jgi:hypothetical protein